MILSLLAAAAPPSPVGSWILAEGWPGMTLTLVPVEQAAEDDWIGIVFQPDGRISWQPHRHYDVWEMGGCSNAFGGFSGSWSESGGRVVIELIEETAGGGALPSRYVVERRTETRLTLRPE